MAVVVLVFHLIICVGLIALVLLQRSEGGALGVGGGGGGALMSGRGAADALAKMTSVAGGVFLATSLALTLIQGAAQTSSNRSVFDSLPSMPAIELPNFGTDEKAAPPAAPTPSTDPLQSAAPAPTQTAAAPISIAPSAASASERAGPVASAPAAAPAATPRPATTATTAATRPAASTATTRPASATRPATRPAATASGVASGVTVPVETTDDPLAVRRDTRAGPDQ